MGLTEEGTGTGGTFVATDSAEDTPPIVEGGSPCRFCGAKLRHTFVEYHRRGIRRVGLGVDAQNPTGAVRVYEKAGMRVLTEDIVFEKELV